MSVQMATARPKRRFAVGAGERVHEALSFMATRMFSPKRRHAVYSRLYRLRYFLFAIVAMLIATATIPAVMILARDSFNNTAALPKLTAPTLTELNASIALGERYIEALYKPLSSGVAVQSEASGVPLKARFTTNDEWVLTGEEVQECSEGSCEPTTVIDPISFGTDTERYTVAFSTQSNHEALLILVVIEWAATPDSYRITVQALTVEEPVEVWLDQTYLTFFTPDVHPVFSALFPTDEAFRLRMLRYTIRHATQAAYLYWRPIDNEFVQASSLALFLQNNGYAPGFDMRAPLFDLNDTLPNTLSKHLPDDLPFNPGAYPDCEITPPSNELAYGYKSKVCLFKQAYLDLGARDPFLQAWQALHLLAKYDDPNRQFPRYGWWMQGQTPTEIAKHLRGQWNRSGFGVPKCTPFSCNEVSGIRTSAFGALQTEMGYRYGDINAQRFADAAARMIVTAQVKEYGQIRMKNATYYRPAQIGAYLTAWDTADARFIEPSTPVLATAIAFALTGEEPIPPEYVGIVPSNSETSLDALGFLRQYRCAKYDVCTE